ncbi:hypothetical protein C455_07907 [Haloferax larsenii JCM 13917]|nr:nuclear transport factor 2 family protein [Haloferax larsenii]ELZ79492.1 hypothetical protein C455_07907 [Haloferax larsenii JCM 13917]
MQQSVPNVMQQSDPNVTQQVTTLRRRRILPIRTRTPAVHPDATYLARLYYTALDDHGYDTLQELLCPTFVHDREDMTLDGRDEFVSFMRDGRPQTDTTHVIDQYIQSKHGDEIVVRGHLEDSTGDELFVFLDRFRARDGKLAELKTFTRAPN